MNPTDHEYLSVTFDDDVLCVSFNKQDLALDDVQEIYVELAKTVESIEHPRVILNLKYIHYLPTTALGMMVSTLTQIRRKGGEMRLACLNENIRELMRIGCLDRIFEIHTTLQEALASLRR